MMKRRQRNRRIRRLVATLASLDVMETEAREVMEYWMQREAEAPAWAMQARLGWARIELSELIRERRGVEHRIARLRGEV